MHTLLLEATIYKVLVATGGYTSYNNDDDNPNNLPVQPK